MDTTSGALSRVLHLLSQHPDSQQKLRQEILRAREVGSGELTYDELVSLPYLDAICRETLRLFVPNLFSTFSSDYCFGLDIRLFPSSEDSTFPSAVNEKAKFIIPQNSARHCAPFRKVHPRSRWSRASRDYCSKRNDSHNIYIISKLQP